MYSARMFASVLNLSTIGHCDDNDIWPNLSSDQRADEIAGNQGCDHKWNRNSRYVRSGL